jgi:murein L,D-transpeptidase YcbB/YkuD
LTTIQCKKEEEQNNPIDKSTHKTAVDTTHVKIAIHKTDWSDKENRTDLIKAIELAPEDGLLSQDYYIEKIKVTENDFSKLDPVNKKTYYKLLNKAFSLYYNHLYNGKLDPKKLYPDWDLDRKPIVLDTLITYALENKKVLSVLENAAPKHPQYKNLKKALAEYTKIPLNDICTIDINDKLFVGSKHPAMIDIKKKLKMWGDVTKVDLKSNQYEESLLKGMKKFQERHGIEATGIIERLTVKALNHSVTSRKEQILANMERWRWFPRNFGNQYLVVNIPEFTLYYYLDGDLASKNKVIVGSAKRKSPVVTSKIDYIVLNPTWTVPTTILKEDYIPSLIENKNYLVRKNITIFDKNQKIIDPENWTPEKAYQYKYVQNAGEHNLLGKVKFVFTNRHFIYLHDTNNKNFFDQTERDLSSGCIRLQNPLELAMQISSPLANYMSKPKNRENLTTKNFYPDEPLKMHVLYWTAWGEDGKAFFRDDIYDFDSSLYTALQKPINLKLGDK